MSSAVLQVSYRCQGRRISCAPIRCLRAAGVAALVIGVHGAEARPARRDRAIAVVILDARSTNLDDPVLLMPDVLDTLQHLTPGAVVQIAGQ